MKAEESDDVTKTKDTGAEAMDLDPKARAVIPDERRFALAGGSDTTPAEFIEAPELEAIASRLVDEFDELIGLRDCEASIRCLWRNEGGKTKGKETLGKATKVSGLAGHYAGCDFVIWLAADHARERELTNHQLEALVFHELLHCTASQDEDGAVKLGVVGHDFEFFQSEIERFGLWRQDLERAREACMQRSLFEKES